jgi:hypothetical protein
MTVAHKDLTGTDLHEVKGASTATAGQVPVASGSGTAPFAKLTHTSLQTTGNPFGAQLVHVREEQSSGVNSTTSTAAGWVASALNTVKTNEVSGASLGSNIVVLPAGTYHFDGRVTSYVTINSTQTILQSRLYNVTAGSVVTYGTVTRLNLLATQGGHQIESHVRGRVTVAGPTGFQLQQQTWANGGAGQAGSLGTEVYADIMFWKVA